MHLEGLRLRCCQRFLDCHDHPSDQAVPVVPWFLDTQRYLKVPALLLALDVPLIPARLFDQENQVDLQNQGNREDP